MFTHLSLSVLLSGLAVTPAPAPAATTSFTNNQLSIVSENDIVDTAIAAGDFDTLVTAVQAAGLVDVLKSDGPFTVFAPTDAAFAALPEGTISSLLQPENQNSLIEILTYHVAADSFLATDVVGTKGIITVNGQQIDVSVSEAGVFTDRAQVTVTDIICSNGVIHVIDAVMLPASGDIVRTAARTNRFNTLLAAMAFAQIVVPEGIWWGVMFVNLPLPILMFLTGWWLNVRQRRRKKKADAEKYASVGGGAYSYAMPGSKLPKEAGGGRAVEPEAVAAARRRVAEVRRESDVEKRARSSHGLKAYAAFSGEPLGLLGGTMTVLRPSSMKDLRPVAVAAGAEEVVVTEEK